MKLTAHQRTEYKNNILFEVIFQARFPQIIRISTEQPANFQDQIRKKGFPETKIKKVADFPSDIPEGIRKAVLGEVLGEDKYMFFSEDGEWQITLTRDFIALKCTDYKNYPEFEGRLKTMLEVFWKEYDPNYFNRVGLRYRNLANEKILETNKDIREFVPPHIAPELKDSISDEVKVIEKTLQLKDETSTVNVRYVYGELSGKFGKYNLNDEKSYIIDIDCFTTEKIRKVEDAIAASRTFNQGNIRNIFQPPDCAGARPLWHHRSPRGSRSRGDRGTRVSADARSRRPPRPARARQIRADTCLSTMGGCFAWARLGETVFSFQDSTKPW